MSLIECSQYRRCKQSKTCRYCSKSKRNRIGYGLTARTADGGSYYSLTLTAAPSSAPLRERIQRLLAAFATLRRRKAFKPFVGGTRWVEVGRDGSPHIHALAQTNAATPDAAAIAREWLDLTGATHTVVKAIDSADYLRNVCYYVDPVAELGDEAREAFKHATRRLRLAATFGTFRGVPLLPRRGKATPAPTTLEYIGVQTRNSIDPPCIGIGLGFENERAKPSVLRDSVIVDPQAAPYREAIRDSVIVDDPWIPTGYDEPPPTAWIAGA